MKKRQRIRFPFPPLLILFKQVSASSNPCCSAEVKEVTTLDKSIPADTRSIIAPEPAHKLHPYLHVLDAQLETQPDDEATYISIKVAALSGSESVLTIRGAVDSEHVQDAQRWVDSLLAKAYGEVFLVERPLNCLLTTFSPSAGVQRKKRLRVLINPFAGPGKSRSLWMKEVEPVFRSAGCHLDVTCTCKYNFV